MARRPPTLTRSIEQTANPRDALRGGWYDSPVSNEAPVGVTDDDPLPATAADAPHGSPRRSAPVRTTLTIVPFIAAAFLASCGAEERAYCVDRDDIVVDEEECDRDYHGYGGGHFWVYPGANRLYGRGDRVNATDQHRSAALTFVGNRGGFGTSGSGRTVKSGGGFSGAFRGGFGG